MQRLEICSVCGLVLRRKKKEVRSSICFFFCFVLYSFAHFGWSLSECTHYLIKCTLSLLIIFIQSFKL